VGLQQAEITGVHASDFSVRGNCGDTLAPGEPCNLALHFSPSAPGTRTAALVVASTAGRLVVSLTGSAAGVGRIRVRPPALDFGAEESRSARRPLPVIVENVGSGPMGIRDVTISPDSRDFQLADRRGCGRARLAQGEACEFAVLFTPRAPGARRATLVIADVVGGSYEVALSECGAPRIPVLSVRPEQLNFTAGPAIDAREFRRDLPRFQVTKVPHRSSSCTMLATFRRSSAV
jgi:hypothetical protein